MLGSVKARLTGLGSTRLVAREFTKCAARYKGETSHIVDDFPYKYLNQRDVSHMSAAMESTARLPLRSFYAQHLPLMPFAKPSIHSKDHPKEDDTRWVHLPVNHGRFPILMSDERMMWNFLPENVARELGPFDREAVMRSKLQEFKLGSKANIVKPSRSVEPEMFTATELQSMLSKKFPILMQHLQKVAATDGEVRVIPLTLENASNHDDRSIEMTSVRRKRKLKMNRHKYRKRLKEQRTKRRRLGK